jgi:hypothetical protein
MDGAQDIERLTDRFRIGHADCRHSVHAGFKALCSKNIIKDDQDELGLTFQTHFHAGCDVRMR